jgi:WD40 repeat protein
MIRYLWALLLSTSVGIAQDITPAQEIVVKGTAKDIMIEGGNLIVATDSGMVQVYDIKAKQFIKEINLPKIKDFIGDEIPARIHSVDFIDGRFLLLSDSGKGGYANLWIEENNATTQLIFPKDKKAIVKARFIDKGHILLGYLGNEAALYDVKTKKERYHVSLSPSKFSDFALNEDKSRAVFSCESGVLNIIDTKEGKVVKVLEGVNLDNVYKVDFKKGVVSGAGQDRRGSLYNAKSGKGDFLQGKFLIYATGLSPSASKVAFAMDEENNIWVYSRSTKSKIALLKGQKSTLNAIIFMDEDTIFSASDDNTVMMWKLK